MNLALEKIDWKKGGGLVPAIMQDLRSGAVLMLGYMNEEALKKTLETKTAWFYSRTKKRLWQKGETSGNIIRIIDVTLDCDGDSLLFQARPTGAVCHTGDYSCFGLKDVPQKDLESLFFRIESRKKEMSEDSYTTSLFKAGLDKITLKVAEESMEVVHAAQKETRERLIEETVDLLYHLFVLLAQKEISLEEIEDEMRKRAKK